jgi:transcription initiation factor TFIIE subunit alpha
MIKSTNKDLLEIITKVVGDDVLPLVRYLKDRKNVSEFKLADKLKLEVNATRNMLYRLHTLNLVTYNRKKDREKGWYISYWTFNKRRIKELMVGNKKEEVLKLQDRLKNEMENENSYFICPSMCLRVDFEEATELDYKCPECGQLLKHQDNTKTIQHLKEKLKELERR